MIPKCLVKLIDRIRKIVWPLPPGYWPLAAGDCRPRGRDAIAAQQRVHHEANAGRTNQGEKTVPGPHGRSPAANGQNKLKRSSSLTRYTSSASYLRPLLYSDRWDSVSPLQAITH